MTAAMAAYCFLLKLFHDQMAVHLCKIRCQLHQRSCLCQLTPVLHAWALQALPYVLV